MTLPLIGRKLGTKPNKWEMNHREHVEAIGFARDIPDGPEFLQKLTELMFDLIPALDEAGKIEACRELATNFGSSDQWMKDRVSECASAHTSLAASTVLRDLFRGYSDTEKDEAVKAVEARRLALIARIRTYIRDNITKARAINKLPQVTPGQKKHVKAYIQNVEKLRSLQDQLRRQLNEEIAERKLTQIGDNRHWPGMSRLFWFTQFSNEELVIDSYDADRVLFPFRFLIHVPVRTYHELFDEWKKSKQPDAVASQLSAEVFTGSYGDTLVTLFKATPFAQDNAAAGIVGILAELRGALLNRRLQSVTLLAVTQAEGAIWKYAEFLNTSGFPIYEVNKRGMPFAGQYLWDRSTLTIVNNPTGNLKGQANSELTSARTLLEMTRIEQAFRPNVVDQIIAEYADDRNSLAHGSLIADERQAIQAALFLGTVYQCITNYEAEGRPLCSY